MSQTLHWILAAVCALLGVADITVFLKAGKGGRTVLHWLLLAGGAVVLALGAFQVYSLLTQGPSM